MARLTPISIPSGIEVTISAQNVSVKGSKGTMEHKVHPSVEIVREDNVLSFNPRDGVDGAVAQSGTARALINNLMVGVSAGFEKKLELVGVGYRAELKGKNLLLTIGYSHPIYFDPSSEITIEVPTPTQIVVSGIDKELVGLVAAKIRSFRKPEPYKGKGIKYSDEIIIRKAGKAAGA